MTVTLIGLASAKGSPGVTTLAVALGALLTPPTVLADLDPAGSDLVLRLRGDDGEPLDPERGLLSLGAAVRRGGIDLADHLQTVVGGLPVLAGVAAAEQGVGLGPVWPYVARTLHVQPGVVIADCGRLAVGSPTLPVLDEADAVVLVARSTVEQLAHLREGIRALQHRGALRGRPVGVLMVAPERDRTAAREAQRLLDSGGLHAKVLGSLALDHKGAQALAGGGRSAGRSNLVRSVRSMLPALSDLVVRSSPVGRLGNAGDLSSVGHTGSSGGSGTVGNTGNGVLR